MIQIKIKKLIDNAKIPTKAHDTDACFDIYNAETEEIIIPPHEARKFRTGFATEIPVGYFCPVFARSSLGIKQNVRLSNNTGIIDSDYRGEWIVALFNDSNFPRTIYPNDRIAQFAILPVPQVTLIETNILGDTERGEGGFGSTGR